MANGDGLTTTTGWADLDYHDFSLTDHLDITAQDAVTGDADGTAIRGGIKGMTVTINGMSGGTFHVEASLDGTNYDPVKDATGVAITFTADGHYVVGDVGSAWVRVRADTVVGATTVKVGGTRGMCA
jgi:hypothetical protein